MTSLSQTQSITVEELLRSQPDDFLPIDLMAGSEGLGRTITSPHVQKTGLALAGFHALLKPGRILILGESEMRYLESLDAASLARTLELAMGFDVPCVLITGGFAPRPELTITCERASVPLLRTGLKTPIAVAKISSMLENSLADRTTVHGVLLDVLGLGVLITGESGIGKSESALDLIARGHRLVADDTVEVRRRSETILVGTCPELTRHHMELRGLGIINVKELFGIACTRVSKRLEMVVQLERWDDNREYDRLGLDDSFLEILGLKIPLIEMPVAPGRNIAILVEVAARNQLLRSRGHHAARLLDARLEERLRRDATGPDMRDEEDEDGRTDGGRR